MSEARRAPHHRRTRAELVGSAPWVEPTIEELAALPQEDRDAYIARKLALDKYRQGARAEEIHGLSISEVGRLHRRGEKVNPATGKPLGFYVCLPGRRLDTKEHRRHAPFNPELAAEGKGQKNVLAAFLAMHGDIKRLLDRYMETRCIGEAAPEPRISAASTVRAFHKLCRAKLLHEKTPLQWPFSARQKGAKAVRTYYEKWKAKNPRRAAVNEQGDAAGQEHAVDAAVANNSLPDPEPLLPVYGRVEVDGISLPAIGAVVFRNKYGVEVTVETRRLYALLARDCRLPLILGARACFGLRYDINDVLGLARDCLFPPHRRELTIKAPEFEYRDGAGYPADVLPGLKGNVWQELAWDADKAHISASESQVIKDLLRCRVASERIGSPTARAFIENLNAFLSAAFKVLASATGTHPKDPTRRDPEAAAVKYTIRIELLEELLDVWARNWNATYLEELGATPLEAAKQLADKYEVFYNPLGALSQQDRRHEFFPRFRRELCFSRKTHGVLLVNLFGAKYSGPTLAGNPHLASTTNRWCTVYVNDQDAREAWIVPDAYPEMRLHVFVQNRALLKFPHALQWRRMTSWWTAGQGRHDRAIRPDTMRAAGDYLGKRAQEGDPDARGIFSTVIGEQARLAAGATSSITAGMGTEAVDMHQPVLDAEEAEQAELDPEHDAGQVKPEAPGNAPKRRGRPPKRQAAPPPSPAEQPAPPPPPAPAPTAFFNHPLRFRGTDIGLGI